MNETDILSFGLSVLVGLLIVLSTGFVLLFLKLTKVCPPNKILVVSTASGKNVTLPRYLRGNGSAVVLPGIHTSGYLPLEPIRIHLPICDPNSAGPDTSRFPRSLTVTVGISDERLEAASTRLLDLPLEQISEHAAGIVTSLFQELAQGSEEPPPLSDLRKQVDDRLAALGLQASSLSFADTGS